SIEAMNISAEVQRDIDLKVDNLLQQTYRTADRLVIDSRMAWHWMPESFKVFLVLDPATAAERIFAHLQGAGRLSENAASLTELLGRRPHGEADAGQLVTRRFRAQRVGFRVPFLAQQIELAADRIAAVEELAGLRDMGAQPVQFLADIGAGDQHRQFLRHPL